MLDNGPPYRRVPWIHDEKRPVDTYLEASLVDLICGAN